MLVVIIQFVVSFGGLRWDYIYHDTRPSYEPGNQVVVVVESTSRQFPLTNSLVLLGLWDGVVSISEWNNYKPTVIDLFLLDTHLVGKVHITPLHSASTVNSNGKPIRLPKRFPHADEPETNTKTLNVSAADDSGRYLDPDPASDRSISYDLQGVKVLAKDIFTAIIESMIIVLHDDSYEPFSHLTGVSASHDCGLSLRQVGPPVIGAQVLDFLSLFTYFFFAARHFETMDFALEEGVPPRTVRLLEGHIDSIRPNYLSSDENDTSV